MSRSLVAGDIQLRSWWLLYSLLYGVALLLVPAPTRLRTPASASRRGLAAQLPWITGHFTASGVLLCEEINVNYGPIEYRCRVCS